jgi:transcription antitermination factor NusG
MFTVGQCVRITAGSFRNSPGVVVCGRPDLPANMVTVRLTFWGHPLDVELPACELQAIGDSDDTE